MAKKGRGPGGPHIKNGNLIGAGTTFKAEKNEKGEILYGQSVKKQEAESKQTKMTPSPQIRESKLQQAAKSMAAKLPPKPAVEKKPPAVKPPGK